jgi:hypothetical protein
MSDMNKLVSDFVLQMGLALPVAILVAVSAGKIIHTITSMNMETKITNLAVDVVKEKIVEKLEIILRVYRDTTFEDVNLPAAVNLQEVAERVLFSVDNIHWLNHIYMDLVDHGSRSEYFVQVIKLIGG